MHSSLLALINLVVALLVGSLCIPLLLGRIRMNHWYGMRVSAAYRSNENWYRINSWARDALLHGALHWCCSQSAFFLARA